MTRRVRFTATVEADLLAAARSAVTQGRADSVSAWVNDALAKKAKDEARQMAMREFLRDYKAEFGEFTEAEARKIRERLRRRTIHVRPKRRERAAI